MKAYVDKDACIGCGLCVDICPEVFSLDDDGLAEAINDDIADDVLESAREAEEQCPTGAISIE